MKTFFTIFFAILAAATVILIALAAKSRLDKWNDAKMHDVAEINSMSGTVKEIGDEPITTLSDRSRTLKRLSEIIPRIYGVELDLISLLEHKPFGLPLNKSERNLLRNTREDVESERKATLSSTDTTPSPINSPIAKARPQAISTPSTIDLPVTTPSRTKAAGDSPPTVTIVKPIVIEMTHGKATLSPGMKLPMISRGATTIQVRYLDSAPIIPISVTDAQ